MNTRSVAASRRSSKPFPEQHLNRALKVASVTTGTGTSGSCGGRMFAIGFAGISPSAMHHFTNCWMLLKRTEAVAGVQRASWSSMKDSIDSRLSRATSVVIPAVKRKSSSKRRDST